MSYLNKYYIVAFTIFTRYGFKTYYEHFESLDHAKRFVKNHASIKDNYLIYESINDKLD